MNLIPLRQNLNQMFDDAQLDAFCLQNFPDVYDRFSRGMRKDEKITLLLDHCRRRSNENQRLRGLLAASASASSSSGSKPVEPVSEGTTTAKGTTQLSFDQKMTAVNLLLACASMTTQGRRQPIINELPDGIKGSIERSAVDRVEIINLVNACLKYQSGLKELAKVLGFFEGDSIGMQDLNKFLLKLDGE